MELEGRAAVVTGAASGIGRALAVTLQQRGARLVLADRNERGLHEAADETGGEAVLVDVSSTTDVDRLAEVAGPPALLCLNAGVVSPWTGPVWEAPEDEWRRVFDVNLGGVVNGLRTFVPRMLAAGEPSHILITASLAGLATWPGGGPYAASKHAVITVAEQVALALAPHPISVTVLCPALVRTGISDQGANPADIAVEALDAVEQHRFTVVAEGWAPAITARARRLADGQPPQIPVPPATGP